MPGPDDNPGRHPHQIQPFWLPTLRRYLLFIGAGNLAWESLQLPLYTIWREGTVGELVFAVLHCTGGDVLIALSSLVLALVVIGEGGWPERRYGAVVALAVAFGVGYTIFSEWLNTTVRTSWDYSELMPVVPVIGTGLSPLLQWLAIPLAGFWWASRPHHCGSTPAALAPFADRSRDRA